ncbi:hypothetical protein QQS21_010254 [Conoideocrella luteorostrata]|uniref:Zn(2)-C6 fungal-type domain-containing protein n=1 Tax=Conoideocrella luteorostrata TaxID=1105319 RepID=A0AAJ0CI42_9HYPO|nr:hypothetical protein QQS21_010254 [Conoideocrella luteorostrata]
MGESPGDGTQSRPACSECQRRKQKCNREWPCNHCQKRKVADKCCFSNSNRQPGSDRPAAQTANRKRQLSHEDHAESADSNPWDDAGCDFEALGYTASHLFTGLNASSTVLTRPYTDALVQNFLNSVNFHSYIIYPSSFLEEYQTWWSLRSGDRPLGLQWTCLLLTVCACSAQYAEAELQQKLEMDLGQTAQKFSERFHSAARELHSVVPVGNNHPLNVQSLLHSCYWYRSEARFVESWHVLSTAVREAQEIGIHQETATGPMPEFDREMRRRLWCIINTWDWQLSALLSRPMIIDRTDCDVGLPSLTLEGYSPSPLLHMKLQSELIGQLSTRFGSTKSVVHPGDVRNYQAMLEAWMSKFPSMYDFNDPDRVKDISRPWIVLHRHHLHTIALSMMLEPIRAYLTKPMSDQSPIEELQIRSDGVDYALRLMEALHSFFDHLYPRDAKFHFVLFSIFDTAAVLCSALMHDQDLSIPRRDEMFRAIDKAVAMLKRLNTVTKTARASYEVLVKVAQRIAQPAPAPKRQVDSTRRQKAKELVLTPPSMSQAEAAVASDPRSVGSHLSQTTPPSEPLMYHVPVSQSASPDHYVTGGASALYAPPNTMASVANVPAMMPPVTNGMHMNVSGVSYPSAYVNMTPPTDNLYQNVNFGTISAGELGDLAKLWNYESLNLNFINPEGHG